DPDDEVPWLEPDEGDDGEASRAPATSWLHAAGEILAAVLVVLGIVVLFIVAAVLLRWIFW
ncbi:MAG TPA: hypothetical protein VIC87_17280, partial [Vicinamibacteria bacterium]